MSNTLSSLSTGNGQQSREYTRTNVMNIHISTMRLRWWIFNECLLQFYYWVWRQWKNFENRSVFDEVTAKHWWLTFLGHPV